MHSVREVSPRLESRWFPTIAFFALWLASLPAAQAAFIDHGTHYEDTTTGLDWLNLSTTVGMSYNQVIAEIGGGSLTGWSYASGAQFNALVGEVIGNPTYNGSFTWATLAQASQLIDIFGGPTSGTAEIYAIAGDAGGNGRLYVGAYAPDPGSPWISGSLGSTGDNASGGFGSLLIRSHVDEAPSASVPLPGALALFGLGFATLVGRRRPAA